MVTTADIKSGFELTDTNNDSKISRAEDSSANMIVHDFRLLDTFKPAEDPANADLQKKTPTALANDQLDKWELNSKYPMWEVENLLKTYGDGKDYLNMLKFAESQNVKYGKGDKCTKAKLTTDLPKDLNNCSDLTSCTTNNDCDKAYESCGQFFYTDTDK